MMRVSVVRIALVATIGAFVAASCGSPVSLGQPDPGEHDDTVLAAPACADAPCGEPCTTAWGVSGLCDGEGVCAPSVSCGEPWPCSGKICGEPCSPCSSVRGDCEEPAELYVCDMAGECSPAAASYCDPCVDMVLGLAMACGTPCHPLCQPWDESCPGLDSSYFCGPGGGCLLPADIASCSPAYLPCPETASCGDPCTLCDGSGECRDTPGLYCTGPLGECVDHLFDCAEVDCIQNGLPCGSQCGFCPPEEPSCQPRFCDLVGSCVPADLVTCGVPPCGPGSCGAACDLCDPSTGACGEQKVFLICDEMYGCTDNPFPTCGSSYYPCVGKVCGEPCSDECDPLDTANCMPPSIKTCNPKGECVEVAEPCL